jgi:hypothetical protein
MQSELLYSLSLEVSFSFVTDHDVTVVSGIRETIHLENPRLTYPRFGCGRINSNICEVL